MGICFAQFLRGYNKYTPPPGLFQIGLESEEDLLSLYKTIPKEYNRRAITIEDPKHATWFYNITLIIEDDGKITIKLPKILSAVPSNLREGLIPEELAMWPIRSARAYASVGKYKNGQFFYIVDGHKPDDPRGYSTDIILEREGEKTTGLLGVCVLSKKVEIMPFIDGNQVFVVDKILEENSRINIPVVKSTV